MLRGGVLLDLGGLGLGWCVAVLPGAWVSACLFSWWGCCYHPSAGIEAEDTLNLGVYCLIQSWS